MSKTNYQPFATCLCQITHDMKAIFPFPFTSYFSIIIITVDYRLFVTWFNDISDLTSKFLWSQIFIGFCNVNFTWFNNTWYNSQTWFKVGISRSLEKFFSDIMTFHFSTKLCFLLLQNFIQTLICFKIDEKYFNIVLDF